MTNEELMEKWKAVLDFHNEIITELNGDDRLKCAQEMEEAEQGEGEIIYKSRFIPAIRRKYSNIPMTIENINGRNYLVTEEMVTECIYEEVLKGEFPKWEQIDKKVKWYFPILEDKSDKSYAHTQNVHVLYRGYTDGIYHHTPKYGSSNVSVFDAQ